MSERMYVFTRFVRFWHWAQAALIIVLLVTGFAIHGSHALIPFGKAVQIHEVAAWLLIGLWIFAIFWHFTTGAWKHYIPTAQNIDRMVRYYAYGIFIGAPHPYKVTLERKHNPLQRLAYLGVKLVINPIIWISGLLYLFWAELAGKVIGNTVLAMGQILGLAAIAIIGLTVTGQTALLQGLGTPIVWFAVFFLFGFILLASLFAAAAAMVSRQEDIGSTTMPLTMLVMAPYMLVILFNDNALVMSIMSYVPFSAPVGMPMRLFLGEAQWWEPLLSLVILLVTCVAAIWVGAKIYENSLLRMGARVKLGEALRG